MMHDDVEEFSPLAPTCQTLDGRKIIQQNLPKDAPRFHCLLPSGESQYPASQAPFEIERQPLLCCLGGDEPKCPRLGQSSGLGIRPIKLS